MPFFRVLGAVVIVVGLYMVIWGKGKDYDAPPLDEEDKTGEKVTTQVQCQGPEQDNPNKNFHVLQINQDIHV